LAIPLACAVSILWTPATAPSASTPVSVFPVPGSAVASPQTQITFRGRPVSQLGGITVTGSRSGAHSGRLLGDSDGRGGSFVPAREFASGETVTVSTSLNILGSGQGKFQFSVAVPAGTIPAAHWPVAKRQRGDVWYFHSRHDLAPAAVRLSRRGRTAAGDIFLAPQFGPIQDGPMILDSSGGLIFFNRLRGNDSAADFRVQRYRGKPVLTWWQGNVSAGSGRGQEVIWNTAYKQIATVRAGNGLSADLHEFLITRSNTALITAYYPVSIDATSVHGAKRQIVLDAVVQEIDIPTGLVLFQWDSLDHVPLTDSYQHLPPRNTRQPYDYFHPSSIDVGRDGNLVISGRNVWTAYKVDRTNGRVLWNLGGKHSSFRIGPGASFAFQHDVRIRASGDRLITVLDNGAGQYIAHKQSRGLKLALNLNKMTATAITQHLHSPSLLSHYEGDYQQLGGGHDFVGWGQQPYLTEYDSRGAVVLDGRFVDSIASYRAYRLAWRGTPARRPAAAASTTRGRTTVYASWNGATGVASWRVLGGSSPGSLRTVTTARKSSFETTITVPAQAYVQVQALDSRGHVLSASVPGRA
jgi:hypothetical protein